MRLRMPNDQVLVEIAPEESTTAGGLYIPHSAREFTRRGRVLAVGFGRVTKQGARAETTVRPGETVVLQVRSGQDISIDGRPHRIVRERDILAVVDGDEAPARG